MFFAIISSISAYSQTYTQDGDRCFDISDYACAVTNYNNAFKNATGKDKQFAEIKLTRAKWCAEHIKTANKEFDSRNYLKAKENYLAVLESNPNDATAKSQLEIINTFLSKPKTTTLSLSKTDILFESSGGSSSISVDSNFSSYTINLLPTWCTVQKYEKYFVINCNSYNASTLRRDYFNVIAGDKTIRVNVVQQGTSQKTEASLSLSKTNLYFLKNGGDENIIVTTNNNNFSIELIPSWCTFQKFSNSIIVSCLQNNTNQPRSDWFKITAGNKEVKVYVNQEASGTEPDKIGSFSSIGIQSGEIAKFGLIYEHGGVKKFGYRLAFRTSLTSEQEIINGSATKNKTEFEIGTNYNINKGFYLNFGIGYGYYKRLLNNDFSGSIFTENKGYFVTTTGIMYRLNNQFNVNCGLAFMDIHEELYKPELTLGVTYNLKSITKNQYKTYSATSKNKSKNYNSSLPSFSSLGFQSGEIAKYGLLYETGGRKTVGFRISARTTLRPEQLFSGGDIENRKEIELGPNFRINEHNNYLKNIYLNLGIGYGNYEFPPYQDKIEYYIATTGIMYRITRDLNINGGLSFNYIDNDIYFNNALPKTEITFGISFNLRGKNEY